MGANLASVQDLNEYNQIQIIVTAAGHGAKQAWIGGTNVQAVLLPVHFICCVFCETLNKMCHLLYVVFQENIWLCSDGSRFDYTHWCSGQNNKDGGNQHCLQINYSGIRKYQPTLFYRLVK